MTELDFDQFIIWATRHVCFTLKYGEPPETDQQRRARQGAEMSKELENLTGEYGDIHFLDLVGVLSKKRTSGGEKELTPQQKRKAKLKATMRKAVKSSLECSELVKKGIEFSTKSNDGFPNLNEDSLRMMVRMCTKEEYFNGQDIITQGEIDARYYVLRRGRVDVIISDPSKLDSHGEAVEIKVASLDWGMGFGEIGLLLATKRTATIRAITPCEVYCLDRPGYETVLSLLPEDQRLGPLPSALADFWSLMTGPDGSRRESVDFKAYLKSHVRTAKTLMTAAELEEFDEAEERAVAQSDWAEDCARYNCKLTDSLSKPQYYDAMYQLVDLWSEDQQLSYATFLRWVFDNIAQWDEPNSCYVFRKVDAVECVGDKFEKMKEDARDIEEAKKQAAEEVLQAAEDARLAHAAQIAEEERLLHEENRLEDEKNEINSKLNVLANEERALNKRLAALDDEEAELMRRLASGELSAQEEAEVRARLAAIASERSEIQSRVAAIGTERAELRAAHEQNKLDSQLRELNKNMSKLDDEEARLRARLASGKLTPEEEKEVRARLATIGLERAALQQEISLAEMAKEEAEANGVVALLAAEIAQIDGKLASLDDEEAELMRVST